jgi:polyadenylate-binding protein
MMGEQTKNMLYVSDLADNINENDLSVLFQEFKEQISVIFMNYPSSRNAAMNKGQTALIVFKDPTTAETARNALNLKKLRGKTVRIMRYDKDNSSRYMSNSNLFVKNIPAEVTPRQVYEYFLQFGDIISAKVNEDEQGNHLGYGYIHFVNADSMNKAIQGTEGKTVWGVKLDVKQFQKKNERISSLSTNNNIYVKNIPNTFSDNQIKDLFQKFGKIVFFKSMEDSSKRKFVIVNFENEQMAETAKTTMNGFTIGDSELFVDFLMKKSDRKRLLSSKIMDKNQNLNNIYKYCNLHIRNLPTEMDERQLHEIFSKLGEIRSVKIQKYILETKEKGVKKDYTMSSGFGFVCFVDPETAKAAIEKYTNNYLPGYEKAKRPLLIDYFMPKVERKQVFMRLQQQLNNPSRQQVPVISPMAPYPYNFNPAMMFNNPTMKNMKYPQYNPNFGPNMGIPQQMIRNIDENINKQQEAKADGPDINYLKSLEDDFEKKDYLGEFIFKKIENHPMTISKNLTIDSIGKITGMILGIEDIQEIIDISMNRDQLNQRIQEALELLEQNK